MKIRKFEDSDLENLYSTLSDPEVMKYIEDPYSMEQVKEFLADVGTCDDPRVFAAEDDAGNYVGYVIYHEYDDDSMELGWLLNKSEWGKGYACRLTELMIEMARKAGKDAVIECDPRANRNQTYRREVRLHLRGRGRRVRCVQVEGLKE